MEWKENRKEIEEAKEKEKLRVREGGTEAHGSHQSDPHIGHGGEAGDAAAEESGARMKYVERKKQQF